MDAIPEQDHMLEQSIKNIRMPSKQDINQMKQSRTKSWKNLWQPSQVKPGGEKPAIKSVLD